MIKTYKRIVNVTRLASLSSVSLASLGVVAVIATACGGSSRDAQSPDETARNDGDVQTSSGESAIAPDTNSDQEELAAPGTQGANAAEAIAQARCAREARCDNIGADKKFSSTDDCVQRIRDEWREDLSARECQSGVDDAELNECLSEVRSEDCSSPFETLERVAACTSAEICAD